MNLFDLFAKITLDDSDFNRKLGAAGGAVAKFGNTVGKGIKAAAKATAVIGTGVGAAAGAVAALGKAAVEGYAEYEQLAGGVETLFKDSTDTIMDYAEGAYKTAGMSANEYMSTVTSFSASLLQSLDGDTAKAAAYADQAITDMSDNANKMGTDISMIQNAYQGFAKANYTMLDNLKLGYGGTQKEMYRLMQDAEKLGATFNSEFYLTTKGQLVADFADITTAIHVVQTEMGITGTTAAEAEKTISGSAASMKAAWTNLVTGMADENASSSELIGRFVESIETYADNLIPIISTALGGISKLVSSVMPVIVREIPTIINENLPTLTVAAVGIVSALVDGISRSQNTLMPTIIDTIMFLAESIIGMLPEIVKTGMDIIVSLAQGIAENASTLVPSVVDAILTIVETLTDPDTLSELIPAAVMIITELALALIENVDRLVDAAFSIMNGLIDAILEPETLTKFIEAAAELVAAIGGGMIYALPNLLVNVGDVIEGIFDEWFNADWAQVGKDLLEGVWNGILDKFEWVKGKFAGLVDSLKNQFTGKEGFDEHSPSKWSEKVFQRVMEGGGIGLEKGVSPLLDEVRSVTDRVKDGMQIDTATVDFASSGTGISTAGMMNGLSSALHSGSGGSYTFNLMLPNGTVLASYLLGPLAEYAKANGTPILNPN